MHAAAAALATVLLAGCAQTGGGPNVPGLDASVGAGPAFRQGVVAVANPYGAEAGARMLEQGGNAIDAAVAIAYALNVVEPQSAGIGGGGFMLIHLAAQRPAPLRSTRARTAPAGATPEMFVGVPNSSRCRAWRWACRAWCAAPPMAVSKYGKLTLAQVLRPAIELAEEGFAATPRYRGQPNCGSATSRAQELARVAPRSSARAARPSRGGHGGDRTSRWPGPSG